MLADNVFGRSVKTVVENFAQQENGARIVLAPEADPEHLKHLGVPELDGDGKVTRIVEKPLVPPSEFVVTGLYFYPADVFEVIPTLEPSAAASSRSRTSTTTTSSAATWSTTSSKGSGATPASRSTCTTP